MNAGWLTSRERVLSIPLSPPASFFLIEELGQRGESFLVGLEPSFRPRDRQLVAILEQVREPKEGELVRDRVFVDPVLQGMVFTFCP